MDFRSTFLITGVTRASPIATATAILIFFQIHISSPVREALSRGYSFKAWAINLTKKSLSVKRYGISPFSRGPEFFISRTRPMSTSSQLVIWAITWRLSVRRWAIALFFPIKGIFSWTSGEEYGSEGIITSDLTLFISWMARSISSLLILPLGSEGLIRRRSIPCFSAIFRATPEILMDPRFGGVKEGLFCDGTAADTAGDGSFCRLSDFSIFGEADTHSSMVSPIIPIIPPTGRVLLFD